MNIKLYSNLLNLDNVRGSLESIISVLQNCHQIKQNIYPEAWFLPPGENFYNDTIVLLSNNTTILPFCVMEGPVIIFPHSKIGPSSYLRPGSLIGSFCRIGHSVEVNKSIVLEGTMISHRSYIGHSYIGKSSLIGSGFTSSVRNKYDAPVKIRCLKTNKIILETKNLKLGIITEKNIWIGSHVVTMPGTYISEDTYCGPFNSIGGSKGVMIQGKRMKI